MTRSCPVTGRPHRFAPCGSYTVTGYRPNETRQARFVRCRDCLKVKDENGGR